MVDVTSLPKTSVQLKDKRAVSSRSFGRLICSRSESGDDVSSLLLVIGDGLCICLLVDRAVRIYWLS